MIIFKDQIAYVVFNIEGGNSQHRNQLKLRLDDYLALVFSTKTLEELRVAMFNFKDKPIVKVKGQNA